MDNVLHHPATPVAETERKACRGECGAILPATEEHFYRDRRNGKLRPECRTCYRGDVAKRERRARASGFRVCDYCFTKKRLTEFDRYPRAGRAIQYRETCRSCMEKLANTDPLQEAETDLRKGLQQRQRWAIGLAIMLGRRGMTLQDYKALTGAASLAFERRYSELLREMARDLGEWAPEWDNPAHIPGGPRSHPAGRTDTRANHHRKVA